jgi:hypothetical protein
MLSSKMKIFDLVSFFFMSIFIEVKIEAKVKAEYISALNLNLNLSHYGVYSNGDHLFPFRTEKLSPFAQMVPGLKPGRVCRCQS